MILQDASNLSFIPRRIVSLVPSQTELLFYLGLDKTTIAITKFCVHPPEWHFTKKLIGGTKNIHAQEIKALKPDLIIANKEENIKEQVENLANEFLVWLTDVDGLQSAYKMIADIGQLTGTMFKAGMLINDIRQKFSTISAHQKINTAYLIWRKPYMTVGGDTFIHQMLYYCGLRNIFGNEKRYPVVTVEQLKKSACQLLLLSSEPYPFVQKHADELQKQLPHIKIILVDGEFFSWYGSRLLFAADYFKNLLATIIL